LDCCLLFLPKRNDIAAVADSESDGDGARAVVQ
jgi:hypothetical protein